MNYPNPVIFYRQNNQGTGHAFQFQISYKEDGNKTKVMVFLDAAKQAGKNDNGKAVYDWQNKSTMKLGIADIGELLAVLAGRTSSVGTKGSLYHQTPGGGNKVLNFGFNDEINTYPMVLSTQDVEKNSNKFSIALNHGEAEILTIMLRFAVIEIYNWKAPMFGEE